MANLKVKDSTGADVELKAVGAGSAGDPLIVQHGIAGLIAHDSPRQSTTPPVQNGAIAYNTSLPLVQHGDVTELTATLEGLLFVKAGVPFGLEEYRSVTLSTTTETVLIPAVAGVRHVLQNVIICTNSYETEISFRDATAGAVRFSVRIPTYTNDPPQQTQTLNFFSGWAAQSINSNWTVLASNLSVGYWVKIYSKSFRQGY